MAPMRLPRTTRAVSAACGAILILGAAAAPVAAASLVVSGQWFRTIMPSLPAAGYFTLANPTDRTETLVGADSPGCGSLMLHRSIDEGGQERMAAVASLAVPARGSVAFAPGGYHLMCMSPTAAMARGKTVPVTLHFADGTSLAADFPVRDAMGR